MVSPELTQRIRSEDSLSSDGTDLSEDLHDLPQSERQGVMIHQYSHALYQPPKD